MTTDTETPTGGLGRGGQQEGAGTTATPRTMADLHRGDTLQVARVSGPAPLRRRLLEMGLVPGSAVEFVRRAPLGDPIEVRVHGYHLSLRSGQASLVEVEERGEPAAREAPSAPVTRPAESDASASGSLPERIALLGNPNCGKTTVFNALTGLRQKVANYPGVTVEKKTGVLRHGEASAQVIDLPGTYSLTPSSPDERVAVGVLRGSIAGTERPDVVVVVLDASNLARNLLLATQALDLDLPLVIALSMTDVAARQGKRVDAAALEEALGVPVVPVLAHRGEGIDELKAALSRARRVERHGWHASTAFEAAVAPVAALVEAMPRTPVQQPAHTAAERLISGADPITLYRELEGEAELAAAVTEARNELDVAGIDPTEADIATRYAWIDSVVDRVVSTDAAPTAERKATFSERLDQFLVHPVAGLAVFALIMGALFVSVYYLADPMIGWIEEGIGALGELIAAPLAEGPLRALLLDGIVAGVGGVVVFVPQIALLFLFLALLEDSGYLARASFLMDRLLSCVGLHGKSFIPLLSSHACAIPGVMAARTLENPRDRLITIFVAPFMVCAARLPVYALLIGAFFASYSAIVRGGVLLGLYLFGVLAAVVTALVMRLLMKGGDQAPFLLELPAYRVPMFSQALRVMVTNSLLFIRKAGTLILAFTIVLWALLYYPRLGAEEQADIATAKGLTTAQVEAGLAIAEEAGDDEEALAAAAREAGLRIDEVEAAVAVANDWDGTQVRNSYAGQVGHAMEPVIAPMGYDWKIGVGLLGAFAAREVFVATMGIVYSAGDVEEETLPLEEAMAADTREDGSPLWTFAVALSLLVFFAIAMQCISTVAVVQKEAGWRVAIGQLVFMNVLAWVLATATYQIASRMVG